MSPLAAATPILPMGTSASVSGFQNRDLNLGSVRALGRGPLRNPVSEPCLSPDFEVPPAVLGEFFMPAGQRTQFHKKKLTLQTRARSQAPSKSEIAPRPGAHKKQKTHLGCPRWVESSNQNYLRRRQRSAAAPRAPRAIVVGSGITALPTKLKLFRFSMPPGIAKGSVGMA